MLESSFFRIWDKCFPAKFLRTPFLLFYRTLPVFSSDTNNTLQISHSHKASLLNVVLVGSTCSRAWRGLCARVLGVFACSMNLAYLRAWRAF